MRDTTDEAWADAEARVAAMAAGKHEWAADPGRRVAVGQQRLLDLAEQGDVLDDCLYTAPGRVGGGGAGTTWLVGSPDDVAKALRRYADLGVSHFVLSDTPYEREIARSATPCCRFCAPPERPAPPPACDRKHAAPLMCGLSSHLQYFEIPHPLKETCDVTTRARPAP